MKIGVIQASSQVGKNESLYHSTLNAVNNKTDEVINFGCFPDEKENYSYIEIALEISLLLSSGAVDFMITGCSSGQGMMLACNSCPDVLCGYIENPQDAYLFGRINNGNAVSFPLGLNYGWAGEINLSCTLEKLFDGSFGSGYPQKDAERKRKDTILLKQINSTTKRSAIEIYKELGQKNAYLMQKALQRKNVVSYILSNGTKEDIIQFIKDYID